MNGPLTIEGLSKSFDGVHALDAVTLQFEPGSVTGIVGPNGAGKTTLFNVVTGLTRPDRGTVTKGAVALHERSARQIAQLGLRRTFQTPRVFRNLSVMTNLLLGAGAAERHIIPRSFLHKRTDGWLSEATVAMAKETLAALGIDGKANDLAGELSFGEQKLLELARAWFANPGTLLLDEPSTGLNETRQEAVLERVKAFREQDLTVVLIEHNIKFLLRCADSIVVLKDGCVHSQHARNETSEKQLRELLGLW